MSPWLTDNSICTHKFDNGSNAIKTIYGYAKDAAGKVSARTQNQITFDNASPVIDNLTWQPHIKYFNTATGVGNVTLRIEAEDNQTDNFSSNITDFFVAYEISRNGVVRSNTMAANDDNVSSAS